MTALLRQVTFNPALMYSTTDIALPASGTVRFRRHKGFLSGGIWIKPGYHDAAYASGAFTTAVYLPVPTTGAALYTATVGSEGYEISLAAGASVDLASLLLAGDVADVSAVDQLLGLYATLEYVNGQVATLSTAIENSLTAEQANALYAAKAAYDAHVLTKASAGTLGHIRVGANLSIDGDGILSASGGGGGGSTIVYGAWQNLTLENDWGNLNVVPAGYRIITINGIAYYVELRGEIYRASFISGLTIATLPPGARPPTNWRQQFKLFSATGDGQIIVKDTGAIESYTGGTAMDLSNIRIYLI